MEFLVETLASLRVFVDRADLVLENHVLRGGGTDDFREPSEVGRAPDGPARRADVMSEPEGCETALGRLEVSQGIFTGSGEIATGFIFDLGNVHGGESPRAPQAGQWHSVPVVGFHAVAGPFGHEGGRDDPADLAFLRQIAREPGATRSRFIDEDQGCGFGWQRAHELINVAWPRANGAKGDDLSVVIFGDVGHRDGVLVDIQTDIERARLWHG